MSDSSQKHNSVAKILRHLGHTEVRPVASDHWVPLSEVSGRYGTTDDVKVLISHKESDHICLIDPHTEDLLAEAREGSKKACASHEDEDDGSDTDSAEDLDRLRDKMTCPNVQTVAFLAQLALRRVIDGSPHHKRLVTAANLAALKAWDEGLELTDLDQIQFNTSEAEPPRIVIEDSSSSVSVGLRSRPYVLEEPWGGNYDFAKVCATTTANEG